MLNSVNWTPVFDFDDGVLAKIASITDDENETPYLTIAQASIQLAGFDVYFKDVIENKLLYRAGFDGFEKYDYDYPGEGVSWEMFCLDKAQHTIAHKTLNKGTSEEKTIVVIAIRGTGTEHEGFFGSADRWVSNLKYGLNPFDAEHTGFSRAATRVMDPSQANLLHSGWQMKEHCRLPSAQMM